MKRSACWIGLAAVGLAASTAMAVPQVGTITTTLDDDYRLVGQSVFFQVMTSSGTGGGQLDGTEAPGEVDVFNEVFPPPTLDDNLTFGYLGVILTLDGNGDPVGDPGLVIAMDAFQGIGITLDEIFPGYDASDLASTLYTTFDSQDYFDFSGEVSQNALTNGVTEIPVLNRPGETMDLIAFIGPGESSILVGSLQFSVAPVPEPASIALLGLGGLALRRRR